MALSEKDFDALISELQEKSFNEAKNAFGEKGFERWRNPRFNGPIKDADGFGQITGSCGDTMEIYLKFKEGRVEEASYVTTGCGSSALCGSFAAELAIGKNPDELRKIEPEDILKTIGTFPEKDAHCAYLAIETLVKALENYESLSKET
ncbi:MAG: iron-sulfur cluster assembly scaffold protein [Desulfobacterales bacterium]|nr:MAG: iron-sulfur cluster assembly scaffold protein [Desulfobacterales bacterium]